MEYFFVLGRNPELSLAEVFSYSKRGQNSILNHFQNKNSALIEFEKPFQKEIIQNLGGTIFIGEVLAKGSIKEIIQQLEKKEIYMKKKNNFAYAFLNFAEENSYDKVLEYLKKRFKSEKLKATEKKSRNEMLLQDGETTEGVSFKSNIEEIYFLNKIEEKLYFGKINEKCDYEEIEKRDMKKPVRREELSISPRLAKIMINLSEIKIGEKMLDPFCGIGVILQEALLQGVKVVGIDKDSSAISGAKNNLEWFGFSKENYNLIRSNSSKTLKIEAQTIVTEPYLGEVLKKNPSIEKAKEMQKKYESLMIAVLNNLKEGVRGKIVFTAPLISVGKKRISCNVDEILGKTGLNLEKGFPIQDFRKSQIVGREIYVLEKQKH